MKNFFKENWKEVMNWIVGLAGVFFIITLAPFSFWFPGPPTIRIERVIAVFLSVIIILYLLNKK